MRIGFYAGSFDPFTNGHLHVVAKSAQLFDKVVIGIGIHPKKTRRFDKELMKEAIEQVLIREKLDNVEVIVYDNLSADAALDLNSTFLVRGIRNGMDYEYEENLASINEEISGLDTVYIRAGNLGNISSSMVMEMLRNKKDVSRYLPKEILELVNK
jgi:pantetheine-phosphate adenylyltransferase